MILRGAVVTLLLLVCLIAPGAAQSLKVSESLEALQERARRDSNDAAAHYNLAMGYLSKDRFAQAEAALQQSVALDPQFADGFLALAIVRARDGDFWRGMRKAGRDSVRAAARLRDGYYTKAFLLDPLVDIRIFGSIAWLRGWGDFDGGLKNLFEGKYAAAYDHFGAEVHRQQRGEGLDQVPPVLLWFRSLAAAHSDKLEEAATDLTTLIALTNRLTVADSATDDAPLRANEYRYMLAAIRQRQGKTNDAIDLYREVITNDIGLYMAHVRLAAIYEAVKDYPHAVQERMSAVDANPDDASLLLDLGVTLGKAGMMPQAETRLQLAAAANPRDPRPWFWLGLAQMEEGKKTEARESLTHFLALAPSRYDRQIGMARDRLAQLQ
ncbi:MAG: tetratricopeptide repeat protein [Gemmatimonadota bacterium]